MKLKIKILIGLLMILISLNTTLAYSETYEWEDDLSATTDYTQGVGTWGYSSRLNQIYSNDIDEINGLYFASVVFPDNYIEAGMFPKDSEYNSVTFKIGSVIIGSGIAGYSKGNGKIFVNYWIQEGGLDTSDYSGIQKISIINFPGGTSYTPKSGFKSGAPPHEFIPYVYNAPWYYYTGSEAVITLYTYRYFYNNITIIDEYGITEINIYRSEGNTSKFLITDPSILVNESTYDYSDIQTATINNSINIYGVNYGNGIFDYTYTREIAPGIPTLTTDKTYYNTSEIIEISFTDIDILYSECTEHICEKPYELHILYPVSDAYKQYGTKFIYPLTYNLEDETIYLNTSFLSPENNYILGIVGTNGYYGLHDDILIFSDSFTVYPDDEYLSISCDAESECYTYNNADVTIYYKINNNSDIIIKDNDGNIINTYHNIIDEGDIIYHIPDDINHNNIYPNWKIYLNNTEYSTSFNKDITVYWSQFQTPTPTPTFTPQPTPDINISDTIDEFKTETQPIKDLIFGLSEIVIDNPDYNKDNIVDESEINHWFNSLIPICIIFLLIVLYIGLKKNRND